MTPVLAAGDAGAYATGIAVALGIGLLIGIERERTKGEGPRRAPAGLRTFALVGLLGGIAMLAGGVVVVAVALAFVAGVAALGYVLGDREDPGLTSEVALVVTFLLGALVQEQVALAAGIGVVVAVLLAARIALHRFVRRVLTADELHDLLLFAAAAAVILPLLPDDDIGPYGAINPFATWRLVVLVMLIGGAGYVAIRVVGPRFGLPVAGLAGGFVSSSATIASMGSLARRAPSLLRAALAAALLSTVATFAQMVVVLASQSGPVLRELAWSLAGGGLVAVAFGAVGALRATSDSGPDDAYASTRAFQLRPAITFAAIVAATTFLGAALHDLLGERGVMISAAVAGFADAHAAAASVASLVARGEMEVSSAILPILIGLTTNTVTKIVLALASGGRDYAKRLAPGLVAVIAAAWVGALVATAV